MSIQQCSLKNLEEKVGTQVKNTSNTIKLKYGCDQPRLFFFFFFGHWKNVQELMHN